MKNALILFVLLALIVAGNFVLRSDNDFEVINIENCQLHLSPCDITISGDTKISFNITPRPLPLLKTLNLTVTASGIKVKQMSVDIVGTNMDMGVLTARLKLDTENNYKGVTALGVCAQRKMLWQARLKIVGQNKNYLINFPFETVS